MLETPMQRREEKLQPNSSGISTNALKTIQTLTRDSQTTGECSTNYSLEPLRLLNKYRSSTAMRRAKPSALSARWNDALLGQLGEDSRATDNLTLSNVGIIFGGQPSEYSNLQGKGSMFQSFCMSKSIHAPSAGSNYKPTPVATSSSTTKRLNDDSVEASETKPRIPRKHIVPIVQSPDTLRQLQSKIRLLVQDDHRGKHGALNLKPT